MHIKFLEQFVDTQKFFNDGYETAMYQVQKNKNDLKIQKKQEIILNLENKINNLVICISNENPNLIVGFIKEIIFNNESDLPIFIIHDLVNDIDITPLGITMIYTEQKFNALNKLTLNERFAIFFHQDTNEFIPIPTKFTQDLIDPFVSFINSKKAITSWLSKKV